MTDSMGQNPDFEDPDQPEQPEQPAEEWNLEEPAEQPAEQWDLEEPAGQPAEEFAFGEPIEEMDFTEPSDVSFPSDVVTEDGMTVDGEVTEAVASLSGLGLTTDEEPIIAGEGVPEVEEVVDEFEQTPSPSKGKMLLTWLGRLEIPGVIGICVAIWFIAQMMTVNGIWTASFLILLALIPYSLWKTRKHWTTPQVTATYTVMLAIGTAALLSAIFWLGLELCRYDWDIKAKTAKQSVGSISMAQFAPPSRSIS